MRNATEEFGFAPRDVYNGVFQLHTTKEEHITKVARVGYAELKSFVKEFSNNRGLDEFSHHVVAVSPLQFLEDRGRWKFDFKSIRIAGRVMESMRIHEDNHLWDLHSLLHRYPEGACLVGRVFEAIVHRVLSGKSMSSIPMVSNDSDPPTFSTKDTPQPSTAKPHNCAKAIRLIDITHGLSDVVFSSDEYYIPTPTTDPLFDSFTTDIDASRGTAEIYVFHATTSVHAGSAAGYLLIRKIMAHARKLLGLPGRDAKINVSYFLVCPEDGSQYSWEMPVDREKIAIANDHRWKARSIRIPSRFLTVRRVCSLPILQPNRTMIRYRSPH